MIDCCLQEQEFSSKQAQSLDQELKRILDEQKEERKLLELRFLDAQQDLKRSEFICECVCGRSSLVGLMIRSLNRPHQRDVGDGTEAETRETPAAKATSQGGLPHAETPDARQTPKGM